MVLIVMVFMFESVIGLLSYVYQEQIERDISENLMDTFIHRYGSDKQVTEAVDSVQQQVGGADVLYLLLTVYYPV